MASSLMMSIAALIASSSLSLSGLTSLVAAQPATSPTCLPFPRIEVRGGSRIRVDPDQVQITIEATATRRNASIASELVAGAVASIQELKTSGGFDSVVSLSYRGPDLQYKWVSSTTPGQRNARVPVGYMYREVLMVTASIDVNDTDADADAEEDKGDAASTAATASLTKFAKTAATTVETIIQNIAETASEESAASSTTYTNPDPAAAAAAPNGAGIGKEWDPVPSLDDGSPKDPLVSIQSVRYSLTPKSQASSALRARRLATTDAKKKASVLAESMSLNLGELLYVTDFDSTPITTSNDEVAADSMVMPAMARSAFYSSGGAAAAAPARGPGGDPMKQTFTADVSAAFKASSS
ncbi:hypothetical protein PPROV_000700400 [Pycnococcus provasolii]|uniref:Uncharacterized protein n=1 Tax=Pycnococcus provasolii TaxID=41880 RepID=A0A830HNJ1_9CHLO|nr:hypothetical protein PPROV_000700400 [Pycnococcus provasolii]|mmetsp:Transcript_9350/g.21247  ORF Transcript_9350/g.21247 Transcript_9350/m.21247 type:complete len:355 (+) Transcript_9350:50-1114(+)|eukprot:351910_1